MPAFTTGRRDPQGLAIVMVTIEVQIGCVGSKGRLNATILKYLIIDLCRIRQSTT